MKCESSGVTVLQATFNSDTPGSPPAFNQAVGTLTFNPAAGRITVEDAPRSSLPNKWVAIREDALRATFSQFNGLGKYGFIASLYMPASTTGIATVQFEPFDDPSSFVNFFHLDFMPEGDVRIDDGVRFGKFPRDKPFAVSVKLEITQTSGTAEITLFGEGASGDKKVNISPSLLVPARRFGGVRFWMGFQQHGIFFADDIIVTRTQ